MHEIEVACNEALATDCGSEWAQFFSLVWSRTCASIQAMAQHVDVSPLSAEQGRELILRQFTIPMLSGFLRLCFTQQKGPDPDLWWTSPFRSWVSFAAIQTHVSEQTLLTNLANELGVDQRTIERWAAGEPIGKIGWPYARIVKSALGQHGHQRVGENGAHLLTGWLLLGVAFQSLPLTVRDAVRLDFHLRQQEPWSLEQAIATINQHALDLQMSPIRDHAVTFLESVQQLFAIAPLPETELQQNLGTFQDLIAQQPVLRGAYQYAHDWFSGRLAALQIKPDIARRLYAKAVAGAWWRAGPDQHPLLKEALLYVVGVGDKVAAENYWDKTFMLGLNTGSKRPLDEQEMRRLSFGFEKMFSPQKAKARIPPPVEMVEGDSEFSLHRKDLEHPNRKVKFADGRVRRTPLMVAVVEGTLDDVKRLIAAGGDPNDYISESGEGPLTYAMRRACDRKEPAIMDYLLERDLSTATVNRPASTKRETPLKIAIEMANAKAVTRLIELGAEIEQPCGHLPSALCYAMTLFYNSLHRNGSIEMLAYLSGKTPADVYDAKDGAVLDADLQERRHHLHTLEKTSLNNRQIFDAVMDHFIRPADDHRLVIQTLLQGGADANRRYKVAAYHLAEWTPTLFAAQVGDLGMFRMLVEHPGPNRGNADLTLTPPSPLKRFDALWVAIDHGRHSIVSYLLNREERL